MPEERGGAAAEAGYQLKSEAAQPPMRALDALAFGPPPCDTAPDSIDLLDT
ncbi:MAG: hypothetical protein M3Z05_06080 [Gemmatimonadota bacterium]|nr:hypothetical protein [Gemmatimonadota bacterium]